MSMIQLTMDACGLLELRPTKVKTWLLNDEIVQSWGIGVKREARLLFLLKSLISLTKRRSMKINYDEMSRDVNDSGKTCPSLPYLFVKLL